MLTRKSMILTESQQTALQFLREHENDWCTATNIYQSLYGKDAPSHGISAIGCSLKFLPLKDVHVQVRPCKSGLEYRWTQDVSEAQGLPSTCLTAVAEIENRWNTSEVPTSKPDSLEVADAKLIMDVLEDYAHVIVATKPEMALKCAKLSGKLTGSGWMKPVPYDVQVNMRLNQPVTPCNHVNQSNVYGPIRREKTAEKIVEPEPVEEAVMPEDMTYPELVTAIRLSGAKFGRDWREFAAYAGMDSDYFERVATGQVAQPSRHTMERVYSAIFTVRS